MKAILIIALNTYREIIRDRILYGIIVFALLLIGLSVALGELSFAEQARISADFGFAGIQLSACVLAIFAGSTLVSREIDKQTVLTLLARPLSRAQFLLGKSAGLSAVVLTVIAGLALVLAGLLISLDFTLHGSFFIALVGIVLEALLLTSLALLFGSFAGAGMTVVFAAALFLIGHWVGSLDYFVKKSESPSFKALGGVLSKIVPNLELFNWRAAPVYNQSVPPGEVLYAIGYGLGWVVVLTVATVFIFRKRDFV